MKTAAQEWEARNRGYYLSTDRDYYEEAARKDEEERKKRYLVSLDFGTHGNKKRDSEDRRSSREGCGDCYRLEHGYSFPSRGKVAVCPKCGHFCRGKCSCMEDYNLKKELKILSSHTWSKVFFVLGTLTLIFGIYIYQLAVAYARFSLRLLLIVSPFYLVPLGLGFAFYVRYRVKMRLLSKIKFSRLKNES